MQVLCAASRDPTLTRSEPRLDARVELSTKNFDNRDEGGYRVASARIS
jgi:hypothetical protein